MASSKGGGARGGGGAIGKARALRRDLNQKMRSISDEVSELRKQTRRTVSSNPAYREEVKKFNAPILRRIQKLNKQYKVLVEESNDLFRKGF